MSDDPLPRLCRPLVYPDPWPAHEALVVELLTLRLRLAVTRTADLGAGADELALALASRSNVLILALDSDRETLNQARRIIGEVKEAASPWPVVKLVHINRAGAPDDLAREAIRAELGNEPVTVMGPALGALQQTSEPGQPLVLSRPDDPIAVQLRAFAESLIIIE